MKEVSCWIKGEMYPNDIKGDAVRTATQECPYRVVSHRSIFGGDIFKCTHPGANSEHKSSIKLENGGIMIG